MSHVARCMYDVRLGEAGGSLIMKTSIGELSLDFVIHGS